MARTILVVPCYNEERRLPTGEFLAALDRPDAPALLLVNDGSRDATEAVLAGLAARRPDRVHLLSLPRNLGKAEAVRQGCLRAFDLGAERLGYWDSDLATPLGEVDRFHEVLDAHPRVELVLGSRVVLLGREIHRDPWRHYLGRLVASAITHTLGVPVHDTQCGAKLFRATPRMRDVFARPFLTRWLFDVEILGRLLVQTRVGGLPALTQVARELPLTRWTHVAGSKVRPADFFKAFADLYRIRRRLLDPGAAVPNRDAILALGAGPPSLALRSA